MEKIITVANEKGGVGKTILTVNRKVRNRGGISQYLPLRKRKPQVSFGKNEKTKRGKNGL